MGEIKSTLDLVMEKTRNLTLSSAEKQEQKQKEMQSRLKGLLQKYLDGLLTRNQLKKDYLNLKKDFGPADDTSLVQEILNRLDPDQDNQLLLETLADCCKVDTASIKGTIDEYRNIHRQAALKRTAQLKADLARNFDVSGSAVVPNLEADAQWRGDVQGMRRRFEDHLTRHKIKLFAG
jgi:hypothetical protein